VATAGGVRSRTVTYLAIDIGGTKMAAGLVTDNGLIQARAMVPTSPADPWSCLCEVLDKLGPLPTDVRACGVGCGGPMEPGGETVSPLNIHPWRGFPLRSSIEALVKLPTFVDNDAKALALGEGWIGAAAGERNFMAMVVSTGVGGGIVLDGRLLDGASSNAGHVGHIVVVPNGRQCVCGSRGCLEAEASGTGIADRIGAPAATASIEERVRAGRLVGRAVANVAVLLDVPLTVVAGSVALGFGDVFFDAAQAELTECARIVYTAGAVIKRAGLGADGPLVGAAAVARANLGA
jgi:glucokinase